MHSFPGLPPAEHPALGVKAVGTWALVPCLALFLARPDSTELSPTSPPSSRTVLPGTGPAKYLNVNYSDNHPRGCGFGGYSPPPGAARCPGYCFVHMEINIAPHLSSTTTLASLSPTTKSLSPVLSLPPLHSVSTSAES